MNVLIRGPHGAPAMNFFEYKHILVVGSGVGVTPLLSVWQYMVDRGRSKLVQKEKHLSRFSDTRQSDAHSIESTGIDLSKKTAIFEAGDSRIQSMSSNTVTIMESLTASILQYVFFLSLETVIAVTWIFGHFSLVAFLEMVLASISLIVHVAIMTIGIFTRRRENGAACSKRVCFKSSIEISIILVDIVNLWLSFSVATTDQFEPEFVAKQNSQRVLLIVAMGGLTVFLYAIRIFHIFYAILKPPTGKRKQKNKVSSIQGIFINRQYHGMRFCFEQLLQQPLEGEIWSKAFSLQFYGTQETHKAGESVRRFNNNLNNDCVSFRQGRPDWESVLWKAIKNAQQSDPNGASIGLFFCGSPAIAKCLRSTADRINAKLQFAAKQTTTNGRNPGNFKIVLHVENY